MFTFRDLDYTGLESDYQAVDQPDHHPQQKQSQGSSLYFLVDLISVCLSGSSNPHTKAGVLPAYCDPPNPCPAGYTAEDGCIGVEEFQNKAEFSRKYQASQSCMCDSEHMFSCPDYNQPQVKQHQTNANNTNIFIRTKCPCLVSRIWRTSTIPSWPGPSYQ